MLRRTAIGARKPASRGLGDACLYVRYCVFFFEIIEVVGAQCTPSEFSFNFFIKIKYHYLSLHCE